MGGSTTTDGRRRVGLVLGAGAFTGGAWLTGALAAIAAETGWDPASADLIVGTSAGAVIAAFCAAGVPPWFMVARSAGESFAGMPDDSPGADQAVGAVLRVDASAWPLWPGSPRLALETLRRPRQVRLGARLAAWAPRGMLSTEPVKAAIRRRVASGWAGHPALWIVATDLATGERVVFGRSGAPVADLPDAVAASCAIPGVYRPVEIGGRLYVDGGAHSFSNLDVACGGGLDVVVCLNPQSSAERAGRNVVSAGLRRLVTRRVRAEARQVRAEGTEVVLIEPSSEDLAVIGNNPLSTAARHAVLEQAVRSVSASLRDPQLRAHLGALPQGDPRRVRRPADAATAWAEILEAPR